MTTRGKNVGGRYTAEMLIAGINEKEIESCCEKFSYFVVYPQWLRQPYCFQSERRWPRPTVVVAAVVVVMVAAVVVVVMAAVAVASQEVMAVVSWWRWRWFHGGRGGGFYGGRGGGFYGGLDYGYLGGIYGWDYPWDYGYYDSTPSYYYVPSAPLDYGYYVPTIPDASGYYGSYSMPAPAPAYAVPQGNVAYVDVTVPDPSADIFINGVKMLQKGIMRSFFSPSLTPGKEYTYEFKAEWTDGTKKMTQTRDLPVHAGDHFKINLMASSK